MRSLAGGRCAQQVSDARRAASWQPFGDQARCNHDAIMIRLVSHQWHSASDERISGLSARAASERSAGRLLAAPLCEQPRCNHDAIMIMMMNYRWQSAGDGWSLQRAVGARGTRATACAAHAGTGARAAVCIGAEPTRQQRRASHPRGQSIAQESSGEWVPAPPRHEGESGCLYRSRREEHHAG